MAAKEQNCVQVEERILSQISQRQIETSCALVGHADISLLETRQLISGTLIQTVPQLELVKII